MREILLVGGAPRVRVDAVRYLTVAASGNTATSLYASLTAKQCVCTLLLGTDANPTTIAQRYNDRSELEYAIRSWLALHPTGVVVLSAAINDYFLSEVSYQRANQTVVLARGEKMPSGASEVTVRLRPASKVIDQLRSWGHSGPLVGFKYQDSVTVIEAATALRERVGAAVVVANSLCGSVQALIAGDGVTSFTDRSDLLTALSERIFQLAAS
jgi:hypothetical protein